MDIMLNRSKCTVHHMVLLKWLMPARMFESEREAVPITVAAQSKVCKILYHSNTGTADWNSTRGMDVSLRLFCVWAALCMLMLCNRLIPRPKESYQLHINKISKPGNRKALDCICLSRHIRTVRKQQEDKENGVIRSFMTSTKFARY
jgi:hypothetical protein